VIVYLITNLVNGKLYVGQTVTSLAQRWERHCRESRTVISKAIKKYGRGSFAVEQIGTARNQDELDAIEGLWIRLLASHVKAIGYNVRLAAKGYRTLPAESMDKFRQKRLGHEVTPETRLKVSQGLKKYFETHEHPNKGKTMSDEQYEKMRALTGPRNARFGKKDSPEVREKRRLAVMASTKSRKHKVKRTRNSRTGVPVSEETRRKRSETMRATMAMKKLCKNFDGSKLLAEHAAGNYF
jgi:group I intron endonuclease